MSISKIILGVVVTLGIIHLSGVTNAQANFEGIWYANHPEGMGQPPLEELAFTSAGQAAFDRFGADNDPSFRCVMPGVPRGLVDPYPREIIQQGHQIVLLHEYYHQVRRIYMDGRGHPDDLYPTLMGHSVGYWENGVLVVDTIGLEGSYFRPSGALPYSDSAQITERYSSLPGGKQLQIEFTVTDSDYYQEPWSVIWTYSPAAEILEYRCIVREHLAPESQ